ncbi:MAG TPA: hypothetical protein VF773_05045 [Verrucomicrobiae bacterium]
MALTPNALLFILGEDFDRSLQLQSHLIRSGLRNPIFTIRDFSEAKTQVRNFAEERQWQLAPEPNVAIINLDVRGAALEFLRWKQLQPPLDSTLVFLLAERSRPTVIQEAMNLGANGFFFKDGDLRQFAHELRALQLVTHQGAIRVT